MSFQSTSSVEKPKRKRKKQSKIRQEAKGKQNESIMTKYEEHMKSREIIVESDDESLGRNDTVLMSSNSISFSGNHSDSKLK